MLPLDSFRKLLRPLWLRVYLLASRGVVLLSDDSHKLQELQVGLLKDEIRGPLERFGQYGWTSRPPAGAEVVALFFGGSRDHGVVVAVEDRNARPTGLEEGESCAYNGHGVLILLKKDGSIQITAGSLAVSGSISSGGDVSDAQSTLAQVRQELATLRAVYNIHTHAGVQSGSSTTAPPLPQDED